MASGQDAVNAYLAAMDRADIAAADALRSDGYLETWPVSGERVRGRAARRAIDEADPREAPRIRERRRVFGHGEFWLAEYGLDGATGADLDNVVQTLFVDGGHIHQVTTFVAEPFDAPDWRADWIVPISRWDEPSAIEPEHGFSMEEGRRFSTQYIAVVVQRDFAAVESMRHPEWVAEWPQSGERVPSTSADKEIHLNYPGYPKMEIATMSAEAERWAVSPMLTPVRVAGAGSTWVELAQNTYPSGDTYIVTNVIEISKGKVRRETMYFATPAQPPAWRAPFVERFEPLGKS
ncbi:MAG: hypothetical protein ABIZ34_03115 [Candidatus Limnocylindrales bacterium]